MPSPPPQTPAGIEFLSQWYYQPANYAAHYKTLMYPLEIGPSMQAQFRGKVATSGLTVVIND